MKSKHDTSNNPLISHLTALIINQMQKQEMPEGSHLVEQTLADTLCVSRSPIRKALEVMEQKGIICRRPNRGFFLARPAVALPKPDITPQVSTEEEKYYQIAEDRIQGKLPANVSEAELMSRYGISRVKLMKILVRMSREGWVEKRPGHGWNFLPILDTVEGMEQCYRFRFLIEPAAILEPTYCVDHILLEKLRKEQEDILASPLIDSRESIRMFKVGSNFHEQIVACSGNSFFIEAIQSVNRLRRLVEYQLPVDETRLNSYREHLEIISMLERGKLTMASALLRDHIEQARIKKTAEYSIKKEQTK